MNHKKQLIAETAAALSSYGYQVYLAKSNDYGFYTDGKSVVSFGGTWHFSQDFTGNYEAATSQEARQTGTGWGLATEQGVPTEEEARRYIDAMPPQWAVRGCSVRKTTPEQHLATYGKSSGYVLYQPT